jgi:ABC-type Fe3+-siderophore transport system permease subunit
MQGHTRNPLGDPGLLGVTAGASLAVVASIALLDISSPSGYVWLAFLGALAGTVLVYAIGSAGRGGATPVTLALAGAALSALLYGLVRAVLVSDQQTLDSFRFWVVGSLAGRDADVAWQVGPFVVVGWCSRSSTPSPSTCWAWVRTSPAGWASASGSPGWWG